MGNQLYYGDNLDVMRGSIRDESVDLVYLDPPFNSNASYNVLFRAPSGEQSQAQIEAFDDTWHWYYGDICIFPHYGSPSGSGGRGPASGLRLPCLSA